MAFSDKLLLATVETTRNTYSAPTPATHAVQTRNLVVRGVVAGQLDRNIDSSAGGSSPSTPTEIHRRVTFETELAGSGTAGTAPSVGVILRGTGHSQAVVAATSVTYEPLSEVAESLSMIGYHDGLAFELAGAVGSSRFVFNGNQYPYAEHEFIGSYRTVTDTAVPTNAVFSGWRAPVKIDQVSTTFSLGGASLPMASFELTMARPLVFRDIPNYRGARALDRVPTFRLTVDRPTVAVRNLFADVVNGTSLLATIVVGTAAGSIIELQAYVQPEAGVDLASDNNITTATLSGRVVRVGNPFDWRLIAR